MKLLVLFGLACVISLTFSKKCPPMELSFLLDQSENARKAASDNSTNLTTKFNIMEEQISIILNSPLINNDPDISVGAYVYSANDSVVVIPYWTSVMEAANMTLDLRTLSNSGSWTSTGLRNIVTSPRYNDSVLFIITSQGSSTGARTNEALENAKRVKDLGWNIRVLAVQGNNPLNTVELSALDPNYVNITDQPKSYYGMSREVNRIIENICSSTETTNTSTTSSSITTIETTTEEPTTTTTETTTAEEPTTTTKELTTTETTTATTKEQTSTTTPEPTTTLEPTKITSATAPEPTTTTTEPTFTTPETATTTSSPEITSSTTSKALNESTIATTEASAYPTMELYFLLDHSNQCNHGKTKCNVLDEQLRKILENPVLYNGQHVRLSAYGYNYKAVPVIPYGSSLTKAGVSLTNLRLLNSDDSRLHSGLKNIVLGPAYENNVLFIFTSLSFSSTKIRNQAIAEAKRLKSLGWNIKLIILKGATRPDKTGLTSIDPNYVILTDQESCYATLSKEAIAIINRLCLGKRPRPNNSGESSGERNRKRYHQNRGSSSEEDLY